jgi:hypothetical protein
MITIYTPSAVPWFSKNLQLCRMYEKKKSRLIISLSDTKHLIDQWKFMLYLVKSTYKCDKQISSYSGYMPRRGNFPIYVSA